MDASEYVTDENLRSHILILICKVDTSSSGKTPSYEQTSKNTTVGYGAKARSEVLDYRYIRLTSDMQGQSGWLFSRMPITATNWMVGTTGFFTHVFKLNASPDRS